MMKKVLLSSLLLFALGRLWAVPADASATATIQAGISCTKYIFTMTGGDLEFGLWSSPPGSATVTIDPLTGMVTGIGSSALTYGMGPAAFQVNGTADATFTITLPPGAVTITNGSDTMDVDSWTHDVVGQPQLSAGGSAVFRVGGTLHISAFQALGVYAGSFSVLVDYN